MRWIASSFLISSVSMALLAGCPSREVARVDPAPVKEDKKVIPVQVNRDLDILFLIDDSQSMEQEQAQLIANFPRFIEVLESIEGGLPNVHIGVISTDMGAVDGIGGCNSRGGDNGVLQSTPNGECQAPNGAFIIDKDEDGQRIRNYEGDLSDTFSCVARLGIRGCGFEQHFESIRRALENNPSNTGFLRDEAFLAIIILSDEDDCSTRDRRMFQSDATELGPLSSFRCFEYGVACEGDNDPRAVGPRMNCVPRKDSPFMHDVDAYVEFLKGLKDDPGKIIVAGIMGTADPIEVTRDEMQRPLLAPSCIAPGGDEGAAPPVRLQYFLNQFPQRNTFTTICQDDLREGLVLVAQLLAKVVGNPCIDGNIDTDPAVDGVQYECQVSDVRNPNTSSQEEDPMAECNEARDNLPCWRFQPSDNCTDTPTQLEIVIERAGEAPAGTEVQVRCVVE